MESNSSNSAETRLLYWNSAKIQAFSYELYTTKNRKVDATFRFNSTLNYLEITYY